MIGAMRTARLRMLIVAVVGCSVLAATPAAAKSYSADRFDSVIRVLPDGTLDVTETVVFRFEDGTFSEVFREIPARRTDGIDVLRAEMGGQRLPFGNERGTVELRRRNGRMRVTWRFGPVEGTVREFVLNYRVRGAVRREADADLLAWRATPGEHRYRIASSDIRFELPVPPDGPPRVTARKAQPPHMRIDGTTVQVTTTDIRDNGWIDTTLRFPQGSVIAAPPAWQQHALDVAARAPSWIVGAAIVTIAGFILLFSWRQSYDRPPRDLAWSPAESRQSLPPDNSDPALAGVLGANGRPALEHAMAALFSLAERREIEIAEMPRGTFGQRDFQITRRRSSGRLAGYEQAALDTIFKGSAEAGAVVSLSQARSRLSHRFGRFKNEMVQELTRSGLVDESRKSMRDRYNRAALVLLVLGAMGFAPAALFIPRHGPWPLLIPAAVLLVALGAVIFAAAVTPLSNEGFRRGFRWREYRKHLLAIAQGRRAGDGIRPDATLAFAIALGLAGAWSKFLKHHAHAAPAWFHALPGADGHAAFTSFIATGGAGTSGGAGTGGGGAAGGGASGAR